MNHNQQQLTYAAGSRSKDPNGCRVVEDFSLERLCQLTREFPLLKELADQRPVIISAYPAALGLAGLSTFVDTYLHTVTFVRSCRLAALQDRPVVFVAQPIAGVEFLLQLIGEGCEIPTQMVLVSGGYYFPLSLESFAVDLMQHAGCNLSVIHSYGVAEVGHTCFAALRRSDTGQPMYKQVADDIRAIVYESTGELTLAKGDISIATCDLASFDREHWTIINSPARLSNRVKDTLEGFAQPEWQRFTGRTNWRNEDLVFQVRQGQSPIHSNELPYFEFWDHFDGGPTYKPSWGEP